MRKEKDIPEVEKYPYKVRRLALNLEAHGVPWEQALSEIAGAKGIGNKNPSKAAQWYSDNLPRLEEKYGADFKAVMEDCACCKSGERARQAARIFKENPDFESRLTALAACPVIIGHSLTRVDGKTFDVCFFPEGWSFYGCACLRFGPDDEYALIPKSYCDCCGGHIRFHAEKALGVPLTEEVLASALASKGKDPCRIRLTVRA